MKAHVRTPIALCVLACAFTSPVMAASAKTEPAQQQRTQTDSRVFAVVNGTSISAQEYETTLNTTARNKFYHRQPPEAELVAFKREIADKMINRVLLLAEAKRRGVAPEHDKIRETLAGYEKQYGSSPRWQQERTELLPRVKAQLEQQSVLERLEKEARQVPEPTEGEARAFYKANPNLFTEPEQVRVSVILLKVDPSSPKVAWDKAREEAQAIAKRLKGGADFAELARMHSSDRSAQNGGDMGYIHRGMLPDAVHEEVDKLKPGMTAEPVTLLEGVALIRLVDRKTSHLRSFDQVQKRAGELWQREQSEKRWNEFIAGLRSKASIKVDVERYPELRDSGTDKRIQAVR